MIVIWGQMAASYLSSPGHSHFLRAGSLKFYGLPHCLEAQPTLLTSAPIHLLYYPPGPQVGPRAGVSGWGTRRGAKEGLAGVLCWPGPAVWSSRPVSPPPFWRHTMLLLTRASQSLLGFLLQCVWLRMVFSVVSLSISAGTT